MVRKLRTSKKHNFDPGVERIRDNNRARLPGLLGDPDSVRHAKGSPTPDLRRAAKEAEEDRERYDKTILGRLDAVSFEVQHMKTVSICIELES